MILKAFIGVCTPCENHVPCEALSGQFSCSPTFGGGNGCHLHFIDQETD